jgi:chorismate mutase
MEKVRMASKRDPQAAKAAQDQLYSDAMEIYDRAREEVTIERRDGRRQRYVATRFRQQIEKGHEDDMIVPAVARIVRRRTLGFGHLEQAGRSDLMLESLVIDEEKPYHGLFSRKTVQIARDRMAKLGANA